MRSRLGPWPLALLCSLSTVASAQQGLPLPRLPAREAPPGETSLAEVAARHSPDIYQDVDDSQPRADLITAIDFDGDAVMTNNWEHLDDFTHAQLSGQGTVYWWGSRTATHDFIGYAWFHPRDWEDQGGAFNKVKSVGRRALGKGSGEHENDLEGVLLVIDRRTDTPVLMVTQAHNDFWQYGAAADWAERGREDLDGPLLRDPDTGRVQVYVEAKGHGAYGSPSKTNFKATSGDGVLYTRGGSTLPDRRDAEAVGYALESLTPWWDRFQAVAPGTADETFTRKGSRPAFRGDSRDDDAANPPWAWVDSDYPAWVNRSFFAQPAAFAHWSLRPTTPFALRLTESSIRRSPRAVPAARKSCRREGLLDRLGGRVR